MPGSDPVTFFLAPLLTWIRVLVVCAMLLFIEAVLLFVGAWAHRRSWWLRLSALAPLAASIGAAVADQHIYDTYLYWFPFAAESPHRMPLFLSDYILHGTARAVSDANTLGWLIVIITALLLLVGGLFLVRWALSQRRLAVGRASAPQLRQAEQA